MAWKRGKIRVKEQEGKALCPLSGVRGAEHTPSRTPLCLALSLCSVSMGGIEALILLCARHCLNTSFTSQCVFDHFPCRWGPSPSAMRCLPASVTQPGRGESETALPALSDSKLLALSCSASSPPEGSSAQKHARLALLSLGTSVGPDPNATHAALLLGHKDPLLSPLPDPGR